MKLNNKGVLFKLKKRKSSVSKEIDGNIYFIESEDTLEWFHVVPIISLFYDMIFGI